MSKRISDPAFHNIHYVREMLFQVFSALDRAQRALGFNHSDLGLNNVMEHYPQLLPEVARGEQEANAAALVRGSACLPCAKGAVLEPGHGSPWQRSQSGLGCSVPPPVEGFSVDSSGELSPLGPHIEFKVRIFYYELLWFYIGKKLRYRCPNQVAIHTKQATVAAVTYSHLPVWCRSLTTAWASSTRCWRRRRGGTSPLLQCNAFRKRLQHAASPSAVTAR